MKTANLYEFLKPRLGRDLRDEQGKELHVFRMAPFADNITVVREGAIPSWKVTPSGEVWEVIPGISPQKIAEGTTGLKYYHPLKIVDPSGGEFIISSKEFEPDETQKELLKLFPGWELLPPRFEILSPDGKVIVHKDLTMAAVSWAEWPSDVKKEFPNDPPTAVRWNILPDGRMEYNLYGFWYRNVPDSMKKLREYILSRGLIEPCRKMYSIPRPEDVAWWFGDPDLFGESHYVEDIFGGILRGETPAGKLLREVEKQMGKHEILKKKEEK